MKQKQIEQLRSLIRATPSFETRIQRLQAVGASRGKAIQLARELADEGDQSYNQWMDKRLHGQTLDARAHGRGVQMMSMRTRTGAPMFKVIG